MDFINTIFKFFTDKKHKISSKAITVLLIFIFIVFLDNIFSFSYYFNNSEKISQLEKISNVLKDSTLSNKERLKIYKLRNQILNHKTIKDQVYDYFINIKFNDDKVKKDSVNNFKERNAKIHFITSAWWIVLPMTLMIILIPVLLFTNRSEFIYAFIGILFLAGFGYLVSLAISKLFSLIPLINGNAIYNYILNVILSSLILYIIIKVSKKYEKKTKERELEETTTNL